MGSVRKAIRYNSVGLFFTDSPAASPASDKIYFLNRAQQANLSIDIPRQDIRHIGSEDFLDRKIVSEASVNLTFDYLPTNGYEENLLGLNIASGNCNITGAVYSGIREDKSAFLVVGEEPFDLLGYARRPNGYSGTDAIGVGNCFISNYSVNASVGDFAKASVGMVASNVRYSCIGSGKGGYSWPGPVGNLGYALTQLEEYISLEDEAKVKLQQSEAKTYFGGVPFPSLNLQEGGIDIVGADISYQGENEDGEEVTKTIKNPPTGLIFNPIVYKSPVLAIPPGGINIKIANINVGGPIISGLDAGICHRGAANIQSFQLNVPFEREDLRGFSSMHVYGRKMKYPQMGTLSLSLLSSTFESGNFKEIFCNDDYYNIELNLNNQCDFSCLPSNKHDAFIKFIINNAKLQGYSMSTQIGGFGTVDCTFTFGGSTKNGLFLSGSY